MSVFDKLKDITTGSTNSEFNMVQARQLLLAEQEGVYNTECKKHADWSSCLMNICWNMEKAGSDISVIYKVADYLRSNFGPYTEKSRWWENSMFIIYLKDSYLAGRTPISPRLLEDGSVDKDMTEFLFTVDLFANREGAEWLESGRLCLNNVGDFYYSTVMGEGIKKACDIISQLQSMAANKVKTNTSDPFGCMAERGWSMCSVVLGLDDMGIRGYQLLYALEYAADSAQKLSEVISARTRSQELVDYVNYRTACDYVNGLVKTPYNAVTGGASFCKKGSFMYGHRDIKLIMDYSTVERIITHEPPSLKIDYTKMDITPGVGMEEGIKVAEAHGFVMVRQVNRKDDSENCNTQSIIMYNPHNHDYLKALAKPDSMSYGGASIIAYRTHGNDRIHTDPSDYSSWLNCSSGPLKNHEGVRYYEITHHDGLFLQYGKLTYDTDVQVDYSEVGFGDSYSIPIPDYMSLPTLYRGDAPEKLGIKLFNIMNDMGSFYFNRFICLTLALYDEALLSSSSPHYGSLAEFYWSGGAPCVLDCTLGRDSIDIASLCISYLRVDDDFLNKLMDSFEMNINAKLGKYYGFEKQSDCDKMVRTVRKNLTNKHPLVSNLVHGYGLCDPSELPVKCPWLGREE